MTARAITGGLFELHDDGTITLVALPFGGASTLVTLLLGIVVIAAILGVLTLFGRRRQATAREKARAAQGG